MFKSQQSIREDYVKSQNIFNVQSGYKAEVTTYDKVYKVTWDLFLTAKLNSLNYDDLIFQLKNSQSFFPDSEEDWVLKKILTDNGFDTYELCYKCFDGTILTAHKTCLLNEQPKLSDNEQQSSSDYEEDEIWNQMYLSIVFGVLLCTLSLYLLFFHDWSDYRGHDTLRIFICSSSIIFTLIFFGIALYKNSRLKT